MSLERRKSHWEKLHRASVHIGALSRAIASFKRTNTDPFEITIKEVKGSDGRDYLVVLCMARYVVPRSFGVILGDACNNLRSALDHLLWHLWVSVAPDFNKSVYFPIADSEKDFEQQSLRYLRSGNMRLPERVQSAIEAAQPYKTGNDSLSVLKVLNNIDKHRVIPIIRTSSRGNWLKLTPMKTGAPARIAEDIEFDIAEGELLERETELLRLPMSRFRALGYEQVRVEAEFRHDFCLDETAQVAEGKLVVQTLLSIHKEVERTLVSLG